MAGFRSQRISVPRGATFNPSDNLTAAGQLFADVAGRIDTRAKNQQVNDLLGLAPNEGENTNDFLNRQRTGFSGIDNVSPLEALGLAQKQSQPYFDADMQLNQQQQQDRVFNETSRHNQAIENKTTSKGFGAITDDFGATYVYNKDTGTYTPIQNENAGTGAVPPKFIKTVQVKNKDGLGRETTQTVAIDSRTGEPINPNQSTQGNVAPTLTQKDKDFTKNYGQGSTVINSVKGALGDKGLWGGLDQFTGQVGAFFGSAEGSRQSLLKQDLENLRLEATNKLSGVLSNQDMQIILDTIPTVSDQPDVAQKKLLKVETVISDADANNFNRLAKSNPEAVQQMGSAMFNDEVPEPVGYDVQYNDETGAYRLVRK